MMRNCEGIFGEDSNLESFPVSEYSKKAVGIPLKNSIVLIPMFHFS